MFLSVPCTGEVDSLTSVERVGGQRHRTARVTARGLQIVQARLQGSAHGLPQPCLRGLLCRRSVAQVPGPFRLPFMLAVAAVGTRKWTVGRACGNVLKLNCWPCPGLGTANPMTSVTTSFGLHKQHTLFPGHPNTSPSCTANSTSNPSANASARLATQLLEFPTNAPTNPTSSNALYNYTRLQHSAAAGLGLLCRRYAAATASGDTSPPLPPGGRCWVEVEPGCAAVMPGN